MLDRQVTDSATWTRAEAIDRLRQALLPLCTDGRSLCRVAAERGIFCQGFRRWPVREFHERWKPFLGVSTHLTRSQMERLADVWQVSEQVEQGVSLACDAQALCPGACRGWNEFSNAEMTRFCREILGRIVTVAGLTTGMPEVVRLSEKKRDSKVEEVFRHE